ncbi:DUF3566 domain-containing protein [Demequina sp. NBRC 110056]|uniref:DUF3566 domain-containing protein n=1 Tax=Demequina sp. NBRC 110056 TaxID=1570345 RepID=UPI001F169130|nr:DUF3566 domain-containing protein [Demequina sp. NBRC 110056]
MNADNRASSGTSSTFTPQPASDGAAAGRPQRSSLRPITGEMPTSGQQATSPYAAPAQQPASGSQSTASTQAPARSPFAPVNAPTSAPSAAPSQAPTTGSEPTTATPPTTGTQPTTGAQPVTGAQPTTGSHPVSTEQAAGEQHSFLGGATVGATVGAGFDKLKGFAVKAKDDLTAGDDIAASTHKGGPRKARVLVSRIDPWSALKMGFLLSVALGIMTVVAVYVIWSTMNSLELFALANDWVQELFTTESQVNILPAFELNKWIAGATLVAVVNVVLLTALSTLGALLYNTVSKVVGGVYVTLTDD